MARLTHSNPAFKRYMQMSSGTTVFAFVEGFGVDPYFYGKFCEQVFGVAGRTYEIVGAWRLGDSGGKSTLLGLYDYLATNASLLATFQGKSSLAVFFLDKDIDDILHSTVQSEHVVYTEHYSVENYLFVQGDIAGAAAAASSMEERELATAIGDPQAWRRRMAELWKEWVTFCVFARKYDINHQGNYRLSASALNTPPDSPTEPAAVQQFKQGLETASGMTAEKFQKAFRAVARLVNTIYARGQHDRLFKGKWYLRLIETAVIRVAAGRPYNAHGLSNGLQAAVSSTVDFEELWGEHYRAPMRTLAARL